MFKVKEKVIYPGHGVALIEEVVEKVVAGSKINFFKLQFLYKDMTVLVPVNNAPHVAIRHLSSDSEIKKVFNELAKQPERKLESMDFTPSGWNKRNKDYQLKIEGGALIDLAKVYRDLMFVARQKDLSFGERNLLQIAEDLIAQEVEIVSQCDRPSVVRKIRSPFKEYVSFPTNDATPPEISSAG
jgi:CarD family transcriptional regulator